MIEGRLAIEMFVWTYFSDGLLEPSLFCRDSIDLCNKEYVKEKVELDLYLAWNKIDVACNQHFLFILSSQENTD